MSFSNRPVRGVFDGHHQVTDAGAYATYVRCEDMPGRFVFRPAAEGIDRV